jgi:hypothetical protein
MTFLLELRQTAARILNYELASQLRHVADALNDAIVELSDMPTEVNMRKVNALWARANRMLNAAKSPPVPTPPSSGPTTATQFTQERITV